MGRELVIVDGNSLASAAYFGVPHLKTSDGTPTGAVFGFVNGIFRFLDGFPSHFCVTFDTGSEERKKVSTTYKANRKPMDEELRVQFPLIQEFLNHMSIPFLAKLGWEADDIIASLVHKFHEDIPISVATRDRDLFQLCAFDNVTILLTRMVRGKAVHERIRSDDVEKLIGVKPNQVAYYKALAGDASDNISGVKGIGDKTAVRLLRDYGDLDNICRAAEANELVPKRVNRLIKEGKDDLETSYKLASLIIKETRLELDSLIRRPSDEEKLEDFYRKLEFHSFLE